MRGFIVDDNLFERLVVCFEKIAGALEGLNETKQKQFQKEWPEGKAVRHAVVTRIPTEEDKILESQGIDGTPLDEWLSIPEEEREFIGEREREFLEEQKKRDASSQADRASESGNGRSEEVGANP